MEEYKEIESPIKENEKENQQIKSLNGKNNDDEHE